MGMDVDAMLMVGAEGIDLNVESIIDNETLYEFAEGHNLDVCSPYYDCCEYERQFVGIEINYYGDDEDLVKQIKEAKDKFFEITSTFGTFQAAPNVY